MQWEKIVENTINKWVRDNALDIPFETLKKLRYALTSSNIPHSSKQAKKASQQYRKEAGRVFQDYRGELKTKLNNINKTLKDRPKWFPNFLWRWLSSPFIDISKVEKSINSSSAGLSTEK
jgi:hypothetical protein